MYEHCKYTHTVHVHPTLKQTHMCTPQIHMCICLKHIHTDIHTALRQTHMHTLQKHTNSCVCSPQNKLAWMHTQFPLKHAHIWRQMHMHFAYILEVHQ